MLGLPDWFWGPVAFVASPLLAALLSGYAVNRWKGREDHIEKRFDELCLTAQDAADLASDYWSGTALDEEMNLREAKILAHLAKMAGLRVLLSGYGSQATSREMEVSESIFLRQTTGGAFGVHNRTAEPQRILACQRAAADFVVAVRRARLNDLRGFWRRR
jgi:hypothetical protein